MCTLIVKSELDFMGYKKNGNENEYVAHHQIKQSMALAKAVDIHMKMKLFC